MHYNSDQLRDYAFNLIEETEAAEIAVHLESCADCRATLESIERQFAALDVLKDQPAVTDDVVASIMDIRPSGRRITIPAAAILAAAAGAAIILGVFRSGNTSDNTRLSNTGSAMERQALPRPPDERSMQRSSLQTIRSTGTSTIPSESTLAELRSEKPFAPASNIELNVLPRRDDVQLTIYNAEDLTLVREKRRLTLKRGWNWLQFMWSNTLIDPTSLSLEPKTHMDQVEITQLVYPSRLNELARWTIFSETNCVAEFELTYFTSGLKWNAFYEATLSTDEQSMQLKSYVRVDNGSGEDYENAQTRLVVGKINLTEAIADLARRPAYQPQLALFGSAMELEDRNEIRDYMDVGVMDDLFGGGVSSLSSDFYFFEKEVLKQALSEYQLYTIEGRETIPDGWGKRLPSFDVQEIGVTNLFKYDEERWGQNTVRLLSFSNTEECNLGKTPLPDGRLRMFRIVDPENRLSYVGEADMKYIPVGEEAEIELGPAQTVMVKPRLMRIRTDNFEFDAKGNVCGWDEIADWKIEIANTRNLPVQLEITRATGSYYWNVDSGMSYQKYDANHIRFSVRLDPQSRKEINYELHVRHGSRTESQ